MLYNPRSRDRTAEQDTKNTIRTNVLNLNLRLGSKYVHCEVLQYISISKVKKGCPCA
jgi:hypothetical protein